MRSIKRVNGEQLTCVMDGCACWGCRGQTKVDLSLYLGLGVRSPLIIPRLHRCTRVSILHLYRALASRVSKINCHVRLICRSVVSVNTDEQTGKMGRILKKTERSRSDTNRTLDIKDCTRTFDVKWITNGARADSIRLGSLDTWVWVLEALQGAKHGWLRSYPVSLIPYPAGIDLRNRNHGIFRKFLIIPVLSRTKSNLDNIAMFLKNAWDVIQLTLLFANHNLDTGIFLSMEKITIPTPHCPLTLSHKACLWTSIEPMSCVSGHPVSDIEIFSKNKKLEPWMQWGGEILGSLIRTEGYFQTVQYSSFGEILSVFRILLLGHGPHGLILRHNRGRLFRNAVQRELKSMTSIVVITKNP
ncbi:hypothetical protein J6590_030792 [Homalodisca vitripennis]|nr:hypothetical protein J6590_030792 [Homalodisca vitripennis]